MSDSVKHPLPYRTGQPTCGSSLSFLPTLLEATAVPGLQQPAGGQ